MSVLERAGLSVLRSLDPETAHGVALKALNAGLAPMPGRLTSDILATRVAGLDLPNPVGLAAGFDKNAVALAALSRTGFGFIEVGATTPRPQPGNPRPRLFRLTQDRAAINRFGFNNDGMAAMAQRLRQRPKSAVIGVNLGANKDSEDRAADFAEVLRTCGPFVDFATVNVSSPNTEKLRVLQGADALRALLDGVLQVRAELEAPVPVFLKIAPDLSDAELAQIAEVAIQAELSGIIATNTTLSREGLHGPHKSEMGGLSGAPLTQRAKEVIGRLYAETGGTLPLIGVGGIGSAEQAYARIRAGASAVQLYTALVYEGISLGARIARGLETLLVRDGFPSVAAAVGVDHR